MTASKEFISWFLTQLPNFLLSDPIKYFVGFIFLGFALRWLFALMHLNN